LEFDAGEMRIWRDRLPPIPLSYEPSPEARLAFHLASHNLSMVRGARECVRSFQALWAQGFFMCISLPARMLFELGAAVAYAKSLAERLEAGGLADQMSADAL